MNTWYKYHKVKNKIENKKLSPTKLVFISKF